MSAQREELLRPVEELPEGELPAVLADVRRHLHAVKDRTWPPAWFGAGQGKTTVCLAAAPAPRQNLPLPAASQTAMKITNLRREP